MSKPKDVSTAVAPEQTPESIDTVGQGIQQTQAYNIQPKSTTFTGQ